MGKEYEVIIKSGDTELVLLTDTRRLSRGAKELAIENGLDVTVNRTAKREVRFAGIDPKPEKTAPATPKPKPTPAKPKPVTG